jgi:plasmid replication initiation protein
MPPAAAPDFNGSQLPLFRALTGELAIRDAQELMAYPFFSLAKSKRVTPIEFQSGDVRVQVEGTVEHGIATIWDADVLIWTTSQIVQARDAGIVPSRRLSATPREILTFLRRGTSIRDYTRLKAALDRLQSTSVATSLRQATHRRLHRFSWINEWKECATGSGNPLGLELIIPDWLYAGITDPTKVLTIDPAYFGLRGGIERWLYRLVRKHAGLQPSGWRFDFPYLHRKSGSLARFSDFALDLRRIAERQGLPGYRIAIARSPSVESLLFYRVPSTAITRHA